MCATEGASGVPDRRKPDLAKLPVRVTEAIVSSGLVDPADHGVVLLSGGPDSVCLLAGLAGCLDPDRLVAVHLNYGLRRDSGLDQQVCERLCADLGIELAVESPPDREGNLQDWARRARYAAAERIRADRNADWIAVGHTATDLAETFVYRLASSPGVRPLLGMQPRRGWVTRPLLALDRAETRSAAELAGLEFVDDLSNDDRAFARARIRNEVLPVLGEINPGAWTNIVATAAELKEDDDLLTELAAAELDRAAAEPDRATAEPGRATVKPGRAAAEPDRADSGIEPGGVGPGPTALPAAAIADLHPALRRRVLRELAERTLGRPVPVPTRLADTVLRLTRDPEGGQVDLGAGACITIESGWIAVGPPAPTPAEVAAPLAVPGEAEWGLWRLRAEIIDPPFLPEGPSVATIDRAAIRHGLRVRAWQQGDRIRPLGLQGSKSLQDLFVDASIPRSIRRELPILLDGDEVAWVAGVALADRFRLRPVTESAVRITAVRRTGRF